MVWCACLISLRRAFLFLPPLSRFASLDDDVLVMEIEDGADEILTMGTKACNANEARASWEGDMFEGLAVVV
jgi:hypothetical protein